MRAGTCTWSDELDLSQVSADEAGPLPCNGGQLTCSPHLVSPRGHFSGPRLLAMVTIVTAKYLSGTGYRFRNPLYPRMAFKLYLKEAWDFPGGVEGTISNKEM